MPVKYLHITPQPVITLTEKPVDLLPSAKVELSDFELDAFTQAFTLFLQWQIRLANLLADSHDHTVEMEAWNREVERLRMGKREAGKKEDS